MKILCGMLLAILISGTTCIGQTPTQDSKATPVAGKIGEVLSWLPADTETLTVARGPFAMPRLTEEQQTKDRELTRAELTEDLQSLPLALFGFNHDILAKRLLDRQVTVAIEGARHFRSPAALGEMPFEGCVIAIFADDVSGISASFIKESAKLSVREETIEGKNVTVFQEKLETDVWTTYVAFPSKNMVLAASNRDYIQEILARMQGKSGKRALPDNLPEWKYVDLSAPIWAIRHFDQSQQDVDPSSPFGGQKSANFPDEQAIGLVFRLDANTGTSATITHLSRNKGTLDLWKHGPRSMESEPAAKDWGTSYREVSTGVVEARYNLKRLESADLFMFILMGELGHAVYL